MAKNPRLRILTTRRYAMKLRHACVSYISDTDTCTTQHPIHIRHRHRYVYDTTWNPHTNTNTNTNIDTGNGNHWTLNALNHKHKNLYAKVSDQLHPKKIVESHLIPVMHPC